MAETEADQITTHLERFLSCDLEELTDAELAQFVLDGDALVQLVKAKQRELLAEWPRRRQ
jgi:hypothetical protein